MSVRPRHWESTFFLAWIELVFVYCHTDWLMLAMWKYSKAGSRSMICSSKS